jgi:phosphatidylglycerol:prolipoprotein diacylglycerol transferase
VHPVSWVALVGLGVLVGLVLQGLLLSRAGEDIGAALFVSAAAVVAGCAGAKVWYVVVQRGWRFDGWCVQGAILGGGVAAGVVLVSGSAIHAGTYLDASAPGLMLGMAVGRPGCFLAGCCYGRPTSSRWGIWSSDRCVGIRRVPTQLIEAALCLVIGMVALVFALVHGLEGSGLLLGGSLAAFVLGRQMILPYRAQPRQTSFGRPTTIALAAVTLIASVVIGLR